MTLHDLLPHWLSDPLFVAFGILLGVMVALKPDPHRKDTDE